LPERDLEEFDRELVRFAAVERERVVPDLRLAPLFADRDRVEEPFVCVAICGLPFLPPV
jgi:hypothetical protein